jgi:hypothetical protein
LQPRCTCPLLQDAVVGLMGIYSSTKTENVKATVASTLSRLLRSSPGMMAGVLERYGQHLLLTGALSQRSKGVYIHKSPVIYTALGQMTGQ